MIKKTMVSLAILGVSGCATIQLPADHLQSNEASIRGAEELGAQGVPAARLHLQLAKDQTETAKQMAARGERRAVLVLARAESDGELALGLAREVSVHTDALKAADDLLAVQARGNR
jgi:hypothetical protein